MVEHRSPKPGAVGSSPSTPAMIKRRKEYVMSKAVAKKKNLAQFVREVRQETAKVTWPSRKESITTTIMVFIMVFFMSTFLFLADWVISAVIQFILGAGA